MTSLVLVLRLAVRNVLRYVRRSVITAVTIALGVLLMFVMIGISEGSYRRAVDTAARSGSGHVVIQHPEQDPIDPEPLPDEEHVLEAAREVEGAQVAPRAVTPVLASSSAGGSNVVAFGVDPAVERDVSMIPGSIEDGEWLPSEGKRVPRAVLGRSLARRLDVEVGDRLVLRAQADGELRAQLTKVGGIYQLGSDEVDAGMVFVAAPVVQELLGQPGAIHQVALVLDDLQRSEEVAGDLQEELPDVEVLTWSEALPALGDGIAADRMGGNVMFLLLFGIVGLAVLNAVLMSVMERVKEFGLMLAVGIRPSTLFSVVVLEALLLSVASCAVGGAAGAALVAWLNHTGMDLALLAGGGQASFDFAGYDLLGTMHPYLPTRRTLSLLGEVILLTVVGSVYPAWKAARVAPVEAISNA